MTTFVQQKFRMDCGVACLAMFLDVDYERVAHHCHGFELVDGGMATFRLTELARRFEVEVKCIDIGLVDWQRPAIVGMPSLNLAGQHLVYWDGARIWDPNDGRPGRRVYQGAGPEVLHRQGIDGFQRVAA